DTAKLMGVVDKNAGSRLLFDMDAVATAARAMINSVMLGAIAASGRLPIPASAFESAIRAGKSSDANLRGFWAGFGAAERIAAERGASARSSPPPLSAGVSAPPPLAGECRVGDAGGTPAVPGDLAPEAARFGPAADIVAAGLRRLVAYQDNSYARLYLDRL